MMRRVSAAACALVCAAVVFAPLSARADVSEANALSAGLLAPANASLQRALQDLKQIKSDDATAGIPVIAVTAHAMQGDQERCLVAGMDGYVTKPIKLEDLFSVIEKVIPGMNRRSETKVPTVTC